MASLMKFQQNGLENKTENFKGSLGSFFFEWLEAQTRRSLNFKSLLLYKRFLQMDFGFLDIFQYEDLVHIPRQ